MSMHRLAAISSALALTAVLAAPALAGSLPHRKSGLWEITTSMPAVPAPMVSQMCIDASTDEAMMTSAKGSGRCQAPKIQGAGNTRTIDTVCQMAKSTVTSHTVVTYTSQAAFHMEQKSQYAPPLHGMSEGTMTQDGKWTGACPADMKPGDVIANGMKINVLNSMNGAHTNGAP